MGQLGTCVAELHGWDDSSEKAIQDVAYVMLRSQYPKVRREPHAAHGPKRNYRCDLLVQDVDVIVEVKRVRSISHSASLQGELNDDLAGFQSAYPAYGVVFLIWDRERYTADRDLFVSAFEEKHQRVRVVFVP